jgi:hypothetical protein
MDIDGEKKRKIEEVQPENLDLESVLKNYIKSTEDISKVLAILTQKVIALEKVFNKDLFKN